MPYIDTAKRLKFSVPIMKLGLMLSNADDFRGNLNYIISKLLKYIVDGKGESYQTFNDLMGVLECCKQEFYRTKVAPYEDAKRLENGDI